MLKKILKTIIDGDTWHASWESLGDLCPPGGKKEAHRMASEDELRYNIAATIAEELNPDMSMTLSLLDDLITKHPEMLVDLDEDLLKEMGELVEGVDISEEKCKEGDFKMCWICKSEVIVENHYTKSSDVDLSMCLPCGSCENKECEEDVMPCGFCSEFPI